MNHRTTFLLAALTIVSASPARGADVLFDFNGGDDNGLVRYDPLAPFGSGATYTFPGNGTYRLTSEPSADPNTLGPARVGSYVPDQTFADFRASVDIVGWNPALNQDLGLAARLTDIGLGTGSGYFLHLNRDPIVTGAAYLVVQRIDGELPSQTNFTRAFSLPDASDGYRLVFTGIGATLTGELFKLGDLNDPLATIALTDTTYASGLTGVLATGVIGGSNMGVDATFDNFRVQSVPEPGSVILLAVGAGVGAWRRRRSHPSRFEVS